MAKFGIMVACRYGTEAHVCGAVSAYRPLYIEEEAKYDHSTHASQQHCLHFG